MRKNKIIQDTEERCHDCGNALPQGKGRISWFCRTIGLCRYCYRHKFPGPKPSSLLTPEEIEERPLSYSQRRYLIRQGFNEKLLSPEVEDLLED